MKSSALKSFPGRVTALMVTNNRLHMAQTNIMRFGTQTYRNKELIVVCTGSSDHVAALDYTAQHCGVASVQVIAGDSSATLGEMRNLALEHAQGEYICQWDDDDIYHPERIALQMAGITQTGAKACLLRDNFHFFADSRELYWCDWAKSPVNPGLPGSLVALRSAMPSYEAINKHEDSSLLRRFGLEPLCLINGKGFLYTYVFQGTNTFDRDHHKAIVNNYALDVQMLRARRPEITQKLIELSSSNMIGSSGIVIKAHDESIAFRWSC